MKCEEMNSFFNSFTSCGFYMEIYIEVEVGVNPFSVIKNWAGHSKAAALEHAPCCAAMHLQEDAGC